MDEIMKALAHKAEDEVADVKGKIGETAEDLMADLRGALNEIRKKAGTAEQVIETNTREHPLQSLALAFGLGFLISLLIVTVSKSFSARNVEGGLAGVVQLRTPRAFDRDGFFEALRLYLERRGLDVDWETAESAPPEALINSLAMALPFEAAEKQALLEAPDLEDRAGALTALMRIDAAESGDEEPRLQ
jgi:ElaB/YqjD/DUF883 family membrane-anchored ribosome-binding protein